MLYSIHTIKKYLSLILFIAESFGNGYICDTQNFLKGECEMNGMVPSGGHNK